MSAKVFSAEDWVAASLRRQRAARREDRPSETGDVLHLPIGPRPPPYVSIFECRDQKRWSVIGLEEWHSARFSDLGSALIYAWGIASPSNARVEVYRRDRVLSTGALA